MEIVAFIFICFYALHLFIPFICYILLCIIFFKRAASCSGFSKSMTYICINASFGFKCHPKFKKSNHFEIELSINGPDTKCMVVQMYTL